MKSTIKLDDGGVIIVEATHDGRAVRIAQINTTEGPGWSQTIRIPLDCVGAVIVGMECAGTRVEMGAPLSDEERAIAATFAFGELERG